ncbi:MAG: M50 family metallopeptidase [Patescibacteria group bacterium]
MVILSILIFLLVINFLVVSHELFHFIAAKRAHLKVEEFCIGFPPRIFKKKREETVYSIGLLPLGGFVKIEGMDTSDRTPTFYSKSVRERFWIIFAGVVANFFLAIILFSIGFSVGLPQAIEKDVPPGARNIGISIVEVAADSPAEKAGIKLGDKIIKITETLSGQEKLIKEIDEVKNITDGNRGKTLIFTLGRGNKIIKKEVLARTSPPENEGAIGIAMARTAIVSYPWYQSILKGVRTTLDLSSATFKYLFQAARDAISGKEVKGIEFRGPIGIGVMVSQMLELGGVYVLQFTAILSLNLAILNALPFPALDGGRLFLLLIEKIRKRPLSYKIESLINNVGFAILIILMIIVSFQDVRRLLRG